VLPGCQFLLRQWFVEVIRDCVGDETQSPLGLLVYRDQSCHRLLAACDDDLLSALDGSEYSGQVRLRILHLDFLHSTRLRNQPTLVNQCWSTLEVNRAYPRNADVVSDALDRAIREDR